MGDSPIDQPIFEEDTVRPRGNEDDWIGVVVQTWHDTDEEDLSHAFLDPGYVVVHALGKSGGVYHQNELKVVDRSLSLGDVCRKSPTDVHSGTVVDVKCYLDLEHAITGDRVLRHTSTHVVQGLYEVDGTPVTYGSWMGTIDGYDASFTVELSNGSIVTLQTTDDVQIHGAPDSVGYTFESLYIGHKITTIKGNLRRGKWIKGRYNASIAPTGTIVNMEVTEMIIKWLSQNPAYELLGREPKPPFCFPKKDLHKLTVVNEVDNISSYQVGDRVHIGTSSAKLLMGIVGNGDTELSINKNAYIVTNTHSRVTIEWQDTTVAEYDAKDLLPYLNVDERDVWPKETVIETKLRQTCLLRHCRYGIVQQVDAAARTCLVKWRDSRVQGWITDENASEVSLYEVESHPDYTFRRGDLCMIGLNTDVLWKGAGSPELPESVRQVFNNMCKFSTLRNDYDQLREILAQLAPRLLQSLDRAIDYHMADDKWYGHIIDFDANGDAIVRLGNDIDYPLINVPIHCLMREILDDENYDPYDDNEYPIDSTDESEWTDEEMDVEMPIPLEFETLPAEENDVDGSFQDLGGDEPIQEDGDEALAKFATLDIDPTGHHHALLPEGCKVLARINREHRTLVSSLPENIFVRTYGSRLDLLKSLIIGNSTTPYAYAPFIFDLRLPPSFPEESPVAYFYSWTRGIGRINPNLYENGMVCLSLLGTWHSKSESESWNRNSTILQVLISLQSLVLVREPYYNEAGFEVYINSPDERRNSLVYSERAYMLSQLFVLHILEHPPHEFEQIVRYLYYDENGPRYLQHVVANLRDAMNGKPLEHLGVDVLSKGAVNILKRPLEQLEALLKTG